MRKAKDTQVELVERETYHGQHLDVNAAVTWFQIEDGCDSSKHVFGIHSDGDLSLYFAANEGMCSNHQIVLSKDAALDFARSIIIMYGEEV